MHATPSPNFAYLAHHDARLVALGTQAEQHFAADPTITLSKLRQFGEVLAQRAAVKVALLVDPGEAQQQLIDRLYDRGVIGATQRSLFHDLRRAGNAAVHDGIKAMGISSPPTGEGPAIPTQWARLTRARTVVTFGYATIARWQPTTKRRAAS